MASEPDVVHTCTCVTLSNPPLVPLPSAWDHGDAHKGNLILMHHLNVGWVVRACSRRWNLRMSAGSRSVGRLVAPTTKTRASSPTADS